MGDKYQGYENDPQTLTQGAVEGDSVTASDTTIINVTRALWVGGAGNVAVRWKNGGTSTIVGVPAGTLLPVRVDQVRATGTTATDMIALY